MYHLLLIAALLGKGPDKPVGHLVIVGGGTTEPEIATRTLALAGGKKAKIVIIPQASARNDAGALSAQMWRRLGAVNVTVLDLKNPAAARAAIQSADLIWIPGGSQSRLMQLLTQNKLVEAIRDRYRQGATVGGTSAGAAVMSRIMLTAENRIDLISDDTKTAEGLGLWPEVIIDQHYVRRGRFNRLFSAVLCHPEDVGIGIDEQTAIVVQGRSFEVVGKSVIVVIDARKAALVQRPKGHFEALGNVSLTVLRAGMKYDLDRGLVTGEEKKLLADPRVAGPMGKSLLAPSNKDIIPNLPN